MITLTFQVCTIIFIALSVLIRIDEGLKRQNARELFTTITYFGVLVFFLIGSGAFSEIITIHWGTK